MTFNNPYLNQENLNALFKEYINECKFIKGLRPATTSSFKYVFKIFNRLVPEVIYPQDLSKERMMLFFVRLQTRERIDGNGLIMTGVRKSTVHTYARKLKTFFSWLEEKNYLSSNPMNGLRFSYPQYRDDRALDAIQIEKIVAAIYSHSEDLFRFKRDLAMIHVFLLCGIRRCELIGLRVQDVAFDKRLLTVRKETSKSKFTRYLPLNSRLCMILEDYISERNKLGINLSDLFVSNKTKQALTENGIKFWVNRYVALSGVKFHVHRFRHTFACALEKRNVSPSKIQKLMGHRNISMTMSYLRSTHASDLREEMNSLSIDDLI